MVQLRSGIFDVANGAYHGETTHADEFDAAIHQETVGKYQSGSVKGHWVLLATSDAAIVPQLLFSVCEEEWFVEVNG